MDSPESSAPLPLGRRRFAQADDECAVGSAASLTSLISSSGAHATGATAQGGAAQDDLFRRLFIGAVAGGFGLGHRGLGDEAVLEVQDTAMSLAAVGENVAEEELQESTVQLLGRGRGDDVSREKVGALELVPEEDMSSQDSGVEAQMRAGCVSAGGSGRREASSGGLLLGGDLPSRPPWEDDGNGSGDDLRAVEGDGFDAGVGAALRAAVRALSEVCLKASNQ